MTHSQEKSSMLGQGVWIFVYLAVLTLLEFGIAVTFNSTILLVAVALGIGVLLAALCLQTNQEEPAKAEVFHRHLPAKGRREVCVGG